MPYRTTPLVNGSVYHVYSKSIAGHKIFTCDREYERMVDTMAFYSAENTPCRFSFFQRSGQDAISFASGLEKIVRIIAYCLMPTHIHLVLEQVKEGGITRFANLLLKSYSKYFNEKYRRKGPLWQGRFNSAIVENDEYLLHLTRYVHLNPVTGYLAEKPQDWPFSSYNEYITTSPKRKLCDYASFIDIEPGMYRDFVEDRIDYQRTLADIKGCLVE